VGRALRVPAFAEPARVPYPTVGAPGMTRWEAAYDAWINYHKHHGPTAGSYREGRTEERGQHGVGHTAKHDRRWLLALSCGCLTVIGHLAAPEVDVQVWCLGCDERAKVVEVVAW
jgi:hypothetical protein